MTIISGIVITRSLKAAGSNGGRGGHRLTTELTNYPCNALMMEGTKTIPERCSDKTYPNHNPHKLVTSEAAI